MTKLKPCPFCGGDAKRENYGLSGNDEVVKCTECGARTRLFLKGVRFGGDVIEAWNRRKGEQP